MLPMSALYTSEAKKVVTQRILSRDTISCPLLSVNWFKGTAVLKEFTNTTA